MKKISRIAFVMLLIAVFILAGCGGAAPAMEEPMAEEPAAEEAYAAEPMEEAPAEEPAYDEVADAESAPSSESNASGQGSGMDTAAAALHTTRKIIKNAEIKLLVEDSDIAIDRTTQVVSDMYGYIISSRIWYKPHAGESYKYATITMGVPVDNFEATLRRLRAISIRVIDENASGEDVTDQYVDLQSQLDNLIATRDRIRTFLDQAKTVEESLRVSAELEGIEAQIAEIQGRMNYLKDRAAYSTITVTIEPELPEILTPTPTPTLTPTPSPTPEPWSPVKTFDSSKKTLTSAYQGIFELLIWIFVVVLPIFAPPAFVVWLLVKWINRKTKKSTDSSREA